MFLLRHLSIGLALLALAVPACAQRSRYVIEQTGGAPGEICFKDSVGALQCFSVPSGDLSGPHDYDLTAMGGGASAGVDGAVQISDGAGGFITRGLFIGPTNGVFSIPAQLDTPTTDGAHLFLTGDSTSGLNWNIDVNQGDLRMFGNSGGTLHSSFQNVGAGAIALCVNCTAPATTLDVAGNIQGTSLQLASISDVVSHTILNAGTNRTDIVNSSSQPVMSFQNLSSPGTIWLGSSTAPMNVLVNGSLTPNSASGVYDLGSLANPWGDSWFSGTMLFASTARVTGDIRPINHITDSLGVATAVFNNVYAAEHRLGSDGVVRGTAHFYSQTMSGSATLQAATVSGRVGIEATTDIYPPSTGSWGMGLSTRRWGHVYGAVVDANIFSSGGSFGSDANLACGVGQAVKNIEVVGGIVVGVSCGAP